MRELVKAPPRAIVPASAPQTPDEARARIVAARARVVKNLETIQRTLKPVTRWAEVVKRHPVAAIGGAFLFGYALSKLFSRK